MDIWVIVLFVVVVLHFLAGFGFLMYKLSSPKKKDDVEDASKTSEN